MSPGMEPPILLEPTSAYTWDLVRMLLPPDDDWFLGFELARYSRIVFRMLLRRVSFLGARFARPSMPT